MSLEEVERVSAQIIELIALQKSLARATNYAYTHVGTNNPEDVAIQYMSPSELYQYRMSKKRGIPFSINKARDRVESPDGAKQFPRMALALDRLFQTTGHTRENVAFIYRRYPGHIALVKAYLKLINAERDAISNADVTLDLFQEYQTCRKILGNAQFVFQHSSIEQREKSVMIRKMQTIMERRMADLAGSKLRASKRSTHSAQGSPTNKSQCNQKNTESHSNSLLPSPPSSPHSFHSKSWSVPAPRFEPYAKPFTPSSLSDTSDTQLNYETQAASYPDYFNQNTGGSYGLPVSPVESSPESSIKFVYGRTSSRFHFNNDHASPPEKPRTWVPDRPSFRSERVAQPAYPTTHSAKSRFFPVS